MDNLDFYMSNKYFIYKSALMNYCVTKYEYIYKTYTSSL